jgi:hypothetical protein
MTYSVQHIAAEDSWDFTTWNLRKFKNSMDYVEMDFAHVHCPSGCCRPLEFRTDWIPDLAPRVLNVTGIFPGEEQEVTSRDVDTGKFYTTDMLKESFGLHFLQQEETTKWEAYQR